MTTTGRSCFQNSFLKFPTSLACTRRISTPAAFIADVSPLGCITRQPTCKHAPPALPPCLSAWPCADACHSAAPCRTLRNKVIHKSSTPHLQGLHA